MALAETAQLAVDLKINGVSVYTSGMAQATAANTKFAATTGVVDKSLQSVSSTTSKLSQIKGGILQGLGIGAGLSGVNALEHGVRDVINVLGDFVTHGIEAEKTNTRLGASLKANIPNWNGNLDAIEAYDNAGAKLGFTNNEMADSMATLVGATHDVAKAQAILATAQDLARFKGISLASATDALTKVDAGSYRILKSLGIQLKDNATQTDALAAVQKVAGGQAAAYATTTAGAQAKLNAAWDDASDKLGTYLLPAVTALANVLSDNVIPALGDTEDAIGRFADASLKELDPLAQLLSAIRKGLPSGLQGPPKLVGDLADYQKGLRDLAIVSRQASSSVVQDLNRLSGGTPNSGFGMAAFARRVTGEFENISMLGKKTDEAFVSGLKSGQSDIDSTWSDIIDTLQHPAKRGKQIGHDIGILTSGALVKALRSSDPKLAAEARHEVETITAELISLDPTAKEAGKKGMDALRAAMKSKNPQIASAAAAIYAAIEQNINQPTEAYAWGLTLAQQVALGLGSSASIAGIEAAARRLMAAALSGDPTHPKPKPPANPNKPKPGSGDSYNPHKSGPEGFQNGGRIGVTVNVKTTISSSDITKTAAHTQTYGHKYTGVTP